MPAFEAEEIAACGDDCGECCGGGFGHTAAGDGEQVGEAEAAPRRVYHGEPRNTVGGMQQRAGKRESVEDFGALA